MIRSRRAAIVSAALPVVLALVVLVGRTAARSADVSAPSGFMPVFETGTGWATDEYTTDVAFGDVDGDGLDEFAIARHGSKGPRVLLVDDAEAGFALLATFGDGWGVVSWATAVAMGDVDGDGRAEIGITRASAVNERAFLFDDAAGDYALLWQTGADWPPTVHAVDIAFGDVDGDGADEFAVANDAVLGPRVMTYDDAAAGFAPLWDAGDDWGPAGVATGVAFGDTNGDELDEVGVTREHPDNARVFLYRGVDGEQLWTYGEAWGAAANATGIAFGNIDDDPAQEMGIARQSGVNERAYVLDDAAADYAVLAGFGSDWNPFAYATAIAFGNVDDDPADEVGVARFASVNPRFFIYDDAAAGFAQQWGSGEGWPGEDYATTIAFGHVQAEPPGVFGVGRFGDDGARVGIFLRAWTLRLPVTAR